MIISSRLAAIRGVKPTTRNGTINHEINGPQYPFIALLKSCETYFCAILI